MQDKTVKTVAVPIVVEVSEWQAQKAKEFTQLQDVVAAVRGVAARLLENFFYDGVILSRKQWDEIDAALGGGVTPENFVERVRSNERIAPDGSLRVVCRIDPAFADHVKQNAEWAGADLQQYCEQFIGFAMMNGWIAYWQPTGFTLHFSEEDANLIREVTGKGMPLGADVADWIRRVRRRPQMPKKEQPEGENAAV